MQPNAMIETLKTLKLHGMAQAVGELASQGSPAYQGAEGILDSLLKAEIAEREVRSVSYQVKVAKFPTYRDLSGFDFSQARGIAPNQRVCSWRAQSLHEVPATLGLGQWTGPRGYSPLSLTHPQKTAFFGCWLLFLKSVAPHPGQSQSPSVYRLGRIRKLKLCEFAALRKVSGVFL
jgi:IstB-like ATP binding protein